MSQKMPITLGFFTCSRGHFGRRGDYLITLDHWARQLPLSLFNLVAHVKVCPDQEKEGEQIVKDLSERGFHVITTVGQWSRGLSMGAAYLSDQIKVSKDPVTNKMPYFLLLEDDSPVICHQCSLEDLLLKSVKLLEENHELVTVRTIRRGDYNGGVPQLADAENGRAFFSPYTDFQPLLMRSLDFHRLGILLEANNEACQTVHCEALWAGLLRHFSRTANKHLVWKPDYAETVHIGVPEADHFVALQRLGIK